MEGNIRHFLTSISISSLNFFEILCALYSFLYHFFSAHAQHVLNDHQIKEPSIICTCIKHYSIYLKAGRGRYIGGPGYLRDPIWISIGPRNHIGSESKYNFACPVLLGNSFTRGQATKREGGGGGKAGPPKKNKFF